MRMPRLFRDRRGTTIVEFAMVLPVMLALLMGLGELAYTAYVRVILSGAMQKAARDSTLEDSTGQADAIDAKVIAAVRAVASKATYVATRKSYQQFGYISGEPFTDSNDDGICNKNEPYSDVDESGSWTADLGASGQGGASDATVYTMVVNFPHLFPVAKIVGIRGDVQLTSTVVLKNQPYGSQTLRTYTVNGVKTTTPPQKNCP